AAPKWTTLDYTVQLQLLRRGGLKGSKAKTGDEVDREFTRVRAEQAAKAAAAKQEGIAAAKAKVSATQRTNQAAGTGNADRASREQTGHVVADLDNVLPTDREETLGALLKDEGNNWWHDVDAAAATLTCPSSKFEKSARADAMRVVDAAEPALGPYPPGLVGVYLRNRLLCLREETGRAAHLLEERGVHRKAGESPLVQLSGLTWNSSIGAGTLTWKGVGHWAMYDYQDQLPLSPEACEQMRFADVRDEPKQCLLLHVAAAYLATPDQPLPTPEAVWTLAAEWRVRWCSQARVAEDSLGPTPERLTQAEADVRVFHHDLLHFGHDRDYRTLVAHPLQRDCLGLAVLRLDAYMRPSVEVVCGSRYSGKAEDTRWVLVHRGHMRLLDAGRLLQCQ
ncbi:TRPT1, partial [Symbiodinium sp. CCMP2592]